MGDQNSTFYKEEMAEREAAVLKNSRDSNLRQLEKEVNELTILISPPHDAKLEKDFYEAMGYEVQGPGRFTSLGSTGVGSLNYTKYIRVSRRSDK
jgi:Icc-related predicted phosphoesterase